MARATLVASPSALTEIKTIGAGSGDAASNLESPLEVGRRAATRLFEFCSEAWSRDSHDRPRDMCSYRYRMDRGEVTATVILRLPGRSNAMVVPNSQNWFRDRTNAQNAAALRALVELGVVRRPSKREEDAMFGDNPTDYRKLVADEQAASKKAGTASVGAPAPAVGVAPPQFNGPYARYKAPMLPQPRWAGRPTWRSLKSAKSASPMSSKSFSDTNEPSSKSDAGLATRRQNSGDASTLADSECSSGSATGRGVTEPLHADRYAYATTTQQLQQQRVGATFGGPYGAHYDQPYIEDGYYAVDPRAHSGFVHHQPPPPTAAAAAAAYDGYYHASQMYSGVYYSVASPPAIDGNSPYGECLPYSVGCGPTPTVTYGHPPQFFYPDSGPQHPGMVQPHQQPCPPMPAAAQPTYTGFAYHHQRRDSVLSEGATSYCPSFSEQQQLASGVCTMRSEFRQQACHAAGIPPSPRPRPPFVPSIHCSTRQPPPRSTAYHQEGYRHTPYRGSWDYGYAEMEAPARHAHGNPPGGGIAYQASSYYGEYASQGYGHMTTYHHAGMPLDGPSRAYAITRGGYSPCGGVVPKSDAPLMNTMPGAYGDTWSPRTDARGGGG